MSEQDIRRIQHMAQQGNLDAAHILELIEVCKRVPEQLSDVSLAMGSDTLNPAERDELLGLFTCGLSPKKPRLQRVVDCVPT